VNDLLRREPYRLFFPLGIALTWAAVLHWLLLALGVIESYRSIFHAMAQVQGFLTCFAVGFLFTMIPRRTGTAPVAWWQIVPALAAPVALAVCAWYERWAVSQLFWLIEIAVLASFLVPRAARGRATLPGSFVWIGLAMLIASAGAVVTGFGAATGRMWLHDLGREVLLQGMFSSLVLGVGGMLIPIVTRGEPPPPARGIPVALHVIAALGYLGSFVLELWSIDAGYALRAAICAAVLALGPRAYRPPSLRGFHRWLVWIAAWMLPLGNALAAALPSYRKAALHVMFIGCFATLTFAISIHVALTHGAAAEPLSRAPRRAIVMAGLLATALAARLLVDADFPRRTLWIGIAAALYLASTLAWTALVAPALAARRPATG
jgi:uncharacterized protein involved in response to NO